MVSERKFYGLEWLATEIGGDLLNISKETTLIGQLILPEIAYFACHLALVSQDSDLMGDSYDLLEGLVRRDFGRKDTDYEIVKAVSSSRDEAFKCTLTGDKNGLIESFGADYQRGVREMVIFIANSYLTYSDYLCNRISDFRNKMKKRDDAPFQIYGNVEEIDSEDTMNYEKDLQRSGRSIGVAQTLFARLNLEKEQKEAEGIRLCLNVDEGDTSYMVGVNLGQSFWNGVRDFIG